MARIIAIANVKGGVGKTTTTCNLAAALMERGKNVLVVDLDPQASLTSSLGCDARQLRKTIVDALSVTSSPMSSLIVKTSSHLSLVPANHELYDVERELQHGKIRILALQSALQPIRAAYDYVLLDCPANAGILTGNALAAADEVIIPFPVDYLAYQTLGWFLAIIRKVQNLVNPNLRIAGLFVAMYNPNLREPGEFIAEVKKSFGLDLPFFTAMVRQTITMEQSARAAQSVLRFAPQSQAAAAYRLLAEEVEEGICVEDKDPFAQVRLGYAALAMQDRPKAYAAFRKATTLAPQIPEAWIGLAQSAPDWGDRVRSLAQAHLLDPDSATLLEGLDSSLNGELQALGKADIPVLMGVAHFLAESGLPDYAFRVYKAVTNLDAEHEEAWLGRSQTAASPIEKTAALRRVLELDPGNPIAQQGLERVSGELVEQCAALVLEGEDLLRQGFHSQAHTLFQQAVEMDAQNERAWIGLARTTDDFEESLTYVQRALQINPENAEARELYSWLWQPSQSGFQFTTRHLLFVLLVIAAIILLAVSLIGYLA